MRIQSLAGISVCAALAFGATPAFAVNTCSVDGSGNYTSPINTDTAHNFGATPTLCGHVITGSNCTVNVTVDYAGGAVNSVSSGNCLEITKGVTLNGNNKTIRCTAGGGSTCGKGVYVTNSGGGADKVVIQDLNITGAWHDGIYGGGSDTEVDTVLIDLEGNGTNGIMSAVKSIDSCKLFDGTGTGIGATCNTVTNTVVRDFGGLGIYTAVCTGSAHSTINNCFVHDNGYGLRANGNLVGDVQVNDSIVSDNACDFQADAVFVTCSLSGPTGMNLSSTWVNDDFIP